MKLFLLAVIAVLLYNSPDARNAGSELLQRTANLLRTDEISNNNHPPSEYTITIPNPFAN